ncbi:hypothetical protein BDZ90DRAFT_106812 [Jaminaea rosea]|uniref:C2H2-type domain-containing protein n=1 Tax=Jaminaea rosea TaxID=1569628 RepID=A0A316UX55_9BASI|nr:hypothetical protein BDZ90DRAFT_106812 [Jaminaea rosea]PWN29368.1 hypothetical protein BDZ90DRAFT_106812 [Jaminaea rosea]
MAGRNEVYAEPRKCERPGCGKSFTSPYSYHSHMQDHKLRDENVSFKCPVAGCGKEYTRQSNLNEHMKIHTDREDGKVHKCGECGLVVGSETALTKHKRRHEVERAGTMYACTVAGCTKKYKATRRSIRARPQRAPGCRALLSGRGMLVDLHDASRQAEARRGAQGRPSSPGLSAPGVQEDGFDSAESRLPSSNAS